MLFYKKPNEFINDAKSSRAFYDATCKQLAAYLRRFGVNNNQDLEDLIQETYIEAFKSLHTLQSANAAKAWLFTIGRRQFIRYLEQKRKQPAATADTGALAFLENGSAAADDTVYASYVCKTVSRRLEKVEDPVKRQALMMFFIELEPLADISAALGTNISTLTTWCNRFRSELKQELERANKPVASFSQAVWRRLLKKEGAAV